MLGNPPIVDVMAPAARLPLEVVGGEAFELLFALYAEHGDGSGESWLHLLGLALEHGGSAEDFVDEVARVRPLELRRHLLGVFVPSWRELVGAETIERAARGDRAAARRLLADERYYGGHSRDALAGLLPLSARETKARLVAALEAGAGRVAGLGGRIEEEVRAARQLADTLGPLELIERLTGGYRYEPEPEFTRVVLVPHLSAGDAVLLCQHRKARIICYPAAVPEHSESDRLLAVGRALGDAKRIAILERLREGAASLDDLAATLGLARSSTHHHLAQLRAARLIALRGNARGYVYELDSTAFEAAGGLVARFVRP